MTDRKRARRARHLIQSRAPRRYYVDARGAGRRLIDFELETFARALRALAHQEGSSAEKISNPALRAPVQKRARRH